MSDNRNPVIRLNKVLKEFNISLDRAIEYLNSKGITIEARPTSKISKDVYNILLENFRKDKSRKIESQKAGKSQEEEKQAIFEELETKTKESEIIRAKSKTPKLEPLVAVDNIDLTPKKERTTAPKKEEKTTQPKKENPPKQEEASIQQEETPKTTDIAEEKVAEKDSEVIKAKAEKLRGIVDTGESVDIDKIMRHAKPKEKTTTPKNSTVKKADKPPINKPKRKRITGKQLLSQKSKPGFRTRKDHLGGKPKAEPSADEVQKQVRETLERLQGKSKKQKGAKYRKEKRDIHRQKTEDELAQQEVSDKVLNLTEFVTVAEMSSMMDVNINEVISACMTLGIMVAMNQRLDSETLSIVAEEFGYTVNFVTPDVEGIVVQEEPEEEDAVLETRAPIVTVMGHVDHGKTSLLDYIRKENVIAGESGGITQHIGAYAVELETGQKITFLDTPGHEAFTAMRTRGTQITDLVVIVIAADDKIMPQTKEAISHAQAANVSIIFAINKIDKPNANPEKIKEELATMDILVEDWGGKVQSQEISAKTGEGVHELLEKILLESELMELKANANKKAQGTVIESLLDKGRGYVATILVQEGVLKIGDFVLVGKRTGKIKVMLDERGRQLKRAGPSTPVSILGLDGSPQAGDKFYVFVDKKEAKQIALKRTQLVREQNIRTQKHVTLDEIGRRIAQGEFKELNILLKGDVDGSVEALTESIQKLSNDEIQINVLHKGVGAITESDILLASASDAIVIGFNVKPMGSARQLAEKEEVDIRTYNIIFDAINDVKDAIEGMLSPETKEIKTGHAEIRELFKVSKIGTVAGCMVMEGKIHQKSKVRIIRNEEVIHTGTLSSLKRFKDDVKEVSKGYDCGLQIKGFNDINVNDIVEAFDEIQVRKKLKE